MDATLVHSDAHVAFGHWQNVQLTVFTGQLQMIHISIVKKLRADLVKAVGHNVVGLVLVLPGCRLPEPDVRNAAIEMMRHVSATERGAAFVVEGSGPSVTVLRTVVSAMLLATRAPEPQKVFSDLPAGAAWLQERSALVGTRFDGNAFLAALTQFRKRQVTAYLPPAAASA